MSSSGSSSGVGVPGLLGVAFVVLKLCGVIDWSWWLVLLPFWIGPALVLVIALMIGLVAIAEGVTKEVGRRLSKRGKR